MFKKYIDSDTIYFHKEILALSLENRPMELLTITGKDDKLLNDREALIEGLFPYHDGEYETRPFIVNKPTVFLTSRVHPGETPASYVLNGILNFILNEKSDQAKILRDKKRITLKMVFSLMSTFMPMQIKWGVLCLAILLRVNNS